MDKFPSQSSVKLQIQNSQSGLQITLEVSAAQLPQKVATSNHHQPVEHVHLKQNFTMKNHKQKLNIKKKMEQFFTTPHKLTLVAKGIALTLITTTSDAQILC